VKKKTLSNNAEKVLKGIGVSPGIVIGKAALLERRHPTFVPRRITVSQVADEVKRFEEAIKKSKEQLEEVKQRILEKGFSQHSYILDVHLKVMEDRMLRDETITMIQEQLVNTEWALKVTLDKISEAFDAIEDEYLKERKEDINHVVERILRNLTGRELRKVEDLKGLKYRTLGNNAAIVKEAFGASPTVVPGSELYGMLDKRAIDLMEYATPADNLDMGFHEVAKYIIYPGLQAPCYAFEVVMKLEKRNYLTKRIIPNVHPQEERVSITYWAWCNRREIG